MDKARDEAREILKDVIQTEWRGETLYDEADLEERITQALEKREARIADACRVGFDCGHAKKDQIGGDCVHCNLVVAEGSVQSLQKKILKMKYVRENALRQRDLSKEEYYDSGYKSGVSDSQSSGLMSVEEIYNILLDVDNDDPKAQAEALHTAMKKKRGE